MGRERQRGKEIDSERDRERNEKRMDYLVKEVKMTEEAVLERKQTTQ